MNIINSELAKAALYERLFTGHKHGLLIFGINLVHNVRFRHQLLACLLIQLVLGCICWSKFWQVGIHSMHTAKCS